MKKWLLLWLFVALCSAVFGGGISETEARNIAVNWLNSKSNIHFSENNIQTVSSKTSGDTLLLYIVSMQPQGWVMISATDKVEPILGYSVNSTINQRELPVQMKDWIDGIQRQIIHSFSSDYFPDSEIQQKWARVKSPEESNTYLKSAQVSVGPLLSSTWDQGRYYNELAPYDETSSAGNNHVWIGCVATAMAQLMKYWEYPIHGTGSNTYTHPGYGEQSVNFGEATYNWGAMPDHLSEENREVQQISYHAAVSVNMDFDPQGSGAFLVDAQYAFINYFNYNSTIFEPSKQEWSDVEWKNQLMQELDKGRPILYSGYNSSGSSGHAFVMDGYNNDYFHFNWGWGGYANGNFLLSALNPGGSNYTYDQSALIGIEPIQTSPISSPYFQGFESGSSGQISTYGVASIVNTEKHSGTRSLELSRTAFSSYSKNSASLTFIVPLEGNLSFWVKRFTPENSSFNNQSAKILTQYGETVLEELFTGDFSDNDWVNYTIDLSAYEGQTVRLMFVQQNFDVVREQWMFIDDIVITGTGQNLAPFTPSLPVPETEATGVDLNPQLRWSGGDPNGNNVSYTVYFGKSSSPVLVDTIWENKYSPGLLDHSTTYYWKVVADDGQLTTEGPVWSFTTRDLPPDMALCGISTIGKYSATICGEIVNDNNSTISERGICWRLGPNASLSNESVKSGQQTTRYSCEISNLLPYETYYARAYAKSSEGVAYSDEQSFMTLPDLPVLGIAGVFDIKRTQALVRGIVVDKNDETITERGIVWSTKPGFLTEEATVVSENGNWTEADSFDVTLTELPGPAKIFFRTYAVNSIGIAYSQEDSFQTFNTIPEIDLDFNNNTLAQGLNYKGSVSEQKLDGRIADTDIWLNDVDDDSIFRATFILQKQFDDQTEFLIFNASDTSILVEGNLSDTLILTKVNAVSVEHWKELIQEVRLFIDNDAPNTDLIREVDVSVFDGFENSAPAIAYLTVIQMNDAPLNSAPPEISGELKINTLANALQGEWNDLLDETSCTYTPSYQWQIMKNGNVSAIDGETSTEFFISEEYCSDSIRIVENIIDANCGGNNSASATAFSQWKKVGTAGQSISFNLPKEFLYTKIPIILNGTASSGLPLSYTMNANSVAHVSGDTVFIDGTGRAIITAMQEGNACFTQSEKVYQILTVNPGTQEIIVNNPGNVNFSDAYIVGLATSSIGLDLTVESSDSTIAYPLNDTVVFMKPGTVNLTFYQPGNENVQAAEPVTIELTIDKGPQELSVSLNSEYQYGDTIDFEVECSAPLDPIIEISDTTVLKLDKGQLLAVGVGSCQLIFSQPGNNYYSAATPVIANVTVNKGDPGIRFNLMDEFRYGNEKISLNVDVSNNLPVTFLSSDTTVAKVKNNELEIVGVGQTSIIASCSGNEFWNSASVEDTITILPGIQQITMADTVFKKYGDADFELPVSVEQGLADFEIAVENSSIVDVNDNVFSIVGVGTTKVSLSQKGNSLWEPANAHFYLAIDKGIQVLDFDSIGDLTFGDDPVTLVASGNTNLPILFNSLDTSVANIDNNQLIILGAGETTITASQAGNELWKDANPVTQQVHVAKAEQYISTLLPDTLTPENQISFADFQTSSGLPVDEIKTSDPNIIEITGESININWAGAVTLTVIQNGNQNYEAIKQVFDFQIIGTTSVFDVQEMNWSVFPNPARNELFVTHDNSVVHPTELKLINATGQELLRASLFEPRQRIDISFIPGGVYFISLTDDQNSYSEKLLIKK